MIIWLNGTFGVGKTTIACKINELLASNKFEILEADEYYNEMKKENPMLLLGGALPQNNKNFIERFKKVIKEKMENENKNLIIVMSITENECKEKLYECLKNNNCDIFHFILTANEETIKTRIEKDNNRDKSFALTFLKSNIIFLNNNFKDAIRINTDDKNVNEIAKEILKNIDISIINKKEVK